MRQQGLSLLEMMVVIAVIGILASIALPQYQTYMLKARFSEVVMATSAHKLAIELAIQSGEASDIDDLDAGQVGIPQAITNQTEHLASLDVANGTITATGTAKVKNNTFTLTPKTENNSISVPIQWAKGGSCIQSGLC